MCDIIYPKRPSEFEIHSRAYYILKHNFESKGYIIRGEVKAKKNSEELRGARFDPVIFDKNKKPVLVIEVKRRSLRNKIRLPEKYEKLQLDVPIVYLGGTDNVLEAVSKYLT